MDGFNCAAPFRGRLVAAGIINGVMSIVLQLCRPLSGAVSFHPRLLLHRPTGRFNCAAPFRGRLEGNAATETNFVTDASIVPPPFGGG